jgi:hypothetical protein
MVLSDIHHVITCNHTLCDQIDFRLEQALQIERMSVIKEKLKV